MELGLFRAKKKKYSAKQKESASNIRQLCQSSLNLFVLRHRIELAMNIPMLYNIVSKKDLVVNTKNNNFADQEESKIIFNYCAQRVPDNKKNGRDFQVAYVIAFDIG